MAAARKKLIDEIFLAAADLSPSEASRYLDKACGGDEELRREVESLLEADREAQFSLGNAVIEAAGKFTGDRTLEFRSKWIGRRIGHYSITEEIGRGGMGAVYKAVRADDQYHAAVAIKVIAQGFQTPEALARFRMERQILASLQHPNIAALLDGGSTEDGIPYIVMEYIEGEPLLDYCRNHNLTINQRLELFRALCAAVQHAHQMLVIHRDIKPGNVLVTRDGVPKLLDFGIGKMLGGDLPEDAATATRTAQRMLTPQYASPEQIRGEVLTTASDTYSLGVLLYEMLTFSSPYKVTSRNPAELGRAVCESQPMRLTAAPLSDPKVRKQLSGDLENIVAMALRKEPARRYHSVQQFSADVGRYIAGMPVTAREETLLYVAGKFIRRNKLASAAFAMLFISIAVGWGLMVREHRRTEERFNEVRKLANALLFDLARDVEHMPNSTPIREKLVRTGLEYLNRLSADSAGDLTLLWEVSQAYERIGDVQGDPDGPNLGQTHNALASYRKSMQMVQTVTKSRRDYETLSCLLWLHYKSGDLELRTSGAARALADYQRGLEVAESIRRELKHERSDDYLRHGYQRISMAQLQAGKVKEAGTSARMAAEAASRWAGRKAGAAAEATMARTMLQFGNVLWLQGDLEHARSAYERAVRTMEAVLQQRPDDLNVRQDLAEAYRRSGDLAGNPSLFHFDDPKLAEEYHRKSLKLTEALAARDKLDAKAQARYAVGLRRLGHVLTGQDPVEAARLFESAIAIHKLLATEAPGDLALKRDLANHRTGYVRALTRLRRFDEARKQLELTIATQREILSISPDTIVVREDMFDAQLVGGEAMLAQGNPSAALPLLNEALWTARVLAERDKDSLYTQRCLALAARRLGDCHAAMGNRTEAIRWYDDALSVWSRWRSEDIGMPYAARREADVQKARTLVAAR